MTGPLPEFDATHDGAVVFRSCRGGCLHSVSLTEAAMGADAAALAEAIILAADVSFLKAALEIRREIVTAGNTPSAALPTAEDLRLATERLAEHHLQRGRCTAG